MKRLRRLFRRITSWSTAARDEERLRAEFEEHIAMQTAENLRAGLSPVEARRQALLKFGSVEAIKDAYRDGRGLPILETLSSDTRHAIGGLRRTPAFTAAVILTVALGIGANTAVFAVIDSILIQPLPYPQADALVGVWHTAAGAPGAGTIGCTPSMYFTYREENKTFEHFGVWRPGDAAVTGIAEPELLRTLLVTYGVLDAVGVKPLLGRWFSRADDTPGSAETVMLTYGYWQRRFGGDRSILGRTLTIESRPRAVIGVMPEDFRFQGDPELILPVRFDRNTLSLGLFNYQGIARLKPGGTLEQTNADVARMLELWLKAWPPNPGMDRTVFQDARFGSALRPLNRTSSETSARRYGW
jgi:putative ABC transport system permease protein